MSTTKPDHERIRQDAEGMLGEEWIRRARVSPFDLARYCLVLLDEAEKKVPALVEAIRQARRDLWWFIENTDEDGHFLAGETEIPMRAMAIQDQVLYPALAAWDDTP